MDERLEKIVKENLGVTKDEVEKMSVDELHNLYEKAMVNEELKAFEASDTGQGVTRESTDAANIVDWLWLKVRK